MQPGPANRRAQRGFTLLEILIATAVAAVVLLVINTTFFGALRLRNTTHERIDTDLAVQRTLGIVRRDLAGLMLPTGPLTGQLQTTTFTSSSQDIAGDRISPDFYTNTGKVDGWNPFSEVQMVAYYLAPATDGSNNKSLVRAVTRNLLPVQDTIPEPQTLLSGVAEATVEFYDGTTWTDTWDSTVTSTLPAAIKFHLVLANGGPNQSGPAPAPVELGVPILVTTSASLAQAAADAAAAAP